MERRLPLLYKHIFEHMADISVGGHNIKTHHANMYYHVETSLTKLVKRTVSRLSLTIHTVKQALKMWSK